MFDVLIIGGGIGGSASALRAAQNNMSVLWLTGDKNTRRRSRSQWVVNIDNMVGLHEDIIKGQIEKTLENAGEDRARQLIQDQHYTINNRQIIQNTVQRLQKGYQKVHIVNAAARELREEAGRFMVLTDSEEFAGFSAILATGVMDEQPQITKTNPSGIPERTSKWIYPFANREQFLYCIRCEGHLTSSDIVAVIGYSPVAAELSLVLHERYGNPVFILTNGENFTASSEQVRLLGKYNIEVISDTIVDILNEGKNELGGFEFRVHGPVKVRFALVALGIHRVYNELAFQVGAELADPQQPVDKRHVLINHKSETSIRNLFVVGDAAKRRDEPVMKQIYTAQEYAVRAVDTIDNRSRRLKRKQLLEELNSLDN